MKCSGTSRELIMRLLAMALLSQWATVLEGQDSDFSKDSARIMKPKFVRPQFRFDNRVAFYEGQTLFLRGYDAGVLLKNKLRVALGYAGLDEDLNAFKETIDSVDVGRLIKVDYGSINIDVQSLETRYFSVGLPMEIAVGYNVLRYKNFTSDEIYRVEEGVIALSHFGLSGTFNPIRWFGLRGVLGYRKMLFNQVKDFGFDGFFTSISFVVDFREIITDIRMYKLMKRHRRGNRLGNAVDLISD
jgi:hypothetical protein